jgi:hypothetical protein
MDKAGTLPIYAYDNVREEAFSPVELEQGQVVIEDHPDDMTVVDQEDTDTSSRGRKRKRRVVSDKYNRMLI